MGKFAIKCPHCGTVNKASTSIFAKKAILCGHCRQEFSIKEARMTSKKCPHCGDTFVYDQAKGKVAVCPSCEKSVDAFHAGRTITLLCPQCSCSVEADENDATCSCPLCDWVFDVQKEVAKAKLVNSSGVSVIRYEGDNSTFIWKHPIEDFNTGSQLIVHESQEAIFFLNGQALDLFGPGKYTLETESLPILKNLYKASTTQASPFHAEVYFINKSVQMGLKWGTDSRVRFIDPATGIPLDIGACGEMNLCVSDSRKLLVKLVGTTGGLVNRHVLTAVGEKSDTVKVLQGYFRAPLMTEVKSYLAATIKSRQLDIMAMDEQMGVLSEALRERIAPRFAEYGLSIPNFYVTYLSLPEDDPNFKKLREMRAAAYLGVKDEEIKADVAQAAQRRKILEAQTEAQLAAIRAQGQAEAHRTMGMAEAEVMRAKGYSEKDKIDAEVQMAYAENLGRMGQEGTGGGGMASDMVNLALGMKMAETVFDRMDFGNLSTKKAETKEEPKPLPALEVWACACGEKQNRKKFCMNCGKPKPEVWDCACGQKGNRGKFCEECGKGKPETWDCVCGQVGNTGKCCPECGAKRPF